MKEKPGRHKRSGLAMGLLALIFINASAQPVSARWLPREVHTIRAFVYDYTQGGEDNISLLKAGRIHPGVINNGGTELDEQQQDRLKAALRSTEDRVPGAFCYDPHHGFVFYDVEGIAMGHIELCFQCGNVKNSPKGLPERQWNWKTMRAILEELELPILKDNAAYTALFTGEEPPDKDGPNWREARTEALTFDGGKESEVDVPAGAHLSQGILTLYPGDEVHLEFEEGEGGSLTKPQVVAELANPERTITFSMSQSDGVTFVMRSTKIRKTVAMDCDHRGVGSDRFARTNLRPTEKGLASGDSWPGTVWTIRLKNIEVTDRPASEVYREKVSQ